MRWGVTSCTPSLFMDGIMGEAGGVLASQPLYIDERVAPFEIEAMEVYTSPSQSPLQYQGIGDCGVLLVWTRHAGGGPP